MYSHEYLYISSFFSLQPLNNRLSHADDYAENEEGRELRPVMTQPDWTIKGGSAIKNYTILNDKRHVLTRDTEENVVLWDILKVWGQGG